MKIVNRTSAKLSYTFKYATGVGCGVVPVGKSVQKSFPEPGTLFVSTVGSIEYSDVTNETIILTAEIS
ncbi:hypothetical protein [Psychroserpens luteolus]|uniref:hypothetical protein n=1 Tax=Psychroserpens luteolus TaxID=2855840 RepID=UPI001E60EA4F|nr:hypothetical protein [Psychroserpens luteolus]MCD2259155.1 hypothetical protein [Psychroserpens luteolus]